MEQQLFRQREKFAADRFAAQCLGAEIDDIGDGYARCSMTIEPRHFNGRGTPMGGAVFTLADFAFAVAANRGGREVVTQAAQATFLEAARGGRLIAEARRLREGGSTCFYEVSVADELGTKVAFVTVNGFVVKK